MAFRTNDIFLILPVGGQHEKHTVEKWNWGNTTAFLATQSMSVQRDTKAYSCHRCCSGKSISITYSECVSVNLGIQHTLLHAPYCHLCPVRHYSIFPNYLINDTIFEKNFFEYKIFLFDFVYSFWRSVT